MTTASDNLWCVQHPSLPTFYLDPRIQGTLTAEHAAEVASVITGRNVSPSNVTLVDRVFC